MTKKMGNDYVWRMVATGLLGAVLAGAPSYFFNTFKKVERQEVIDLIAIHSPYNEDKKLIFTKLEEHDDSIMKLVDTMQKVNITITETNSKLDYIINNMANK